MVTPPKRYEIILGTIYIALIIAAYALALKYYHPKPNFEPPTKDEIIEQKMDEIEIMRSQLLSCQEDLAKKGKCKCFNGSRI